MFVAPVSGKCENAEYILRSAAAKVKWISRGRNDCVICLDCGMDDETKRICQKICRDYGFAKLLTKQEFLKNDKVKIQTKFKQKYCHGICRGFIRQYDKTE